MPAPQKDYFLWHLQRLGVVRADYTSKAWEDASKAWEQAEQQPEPVRVAIIDTGIDIGHPNLAGAIDCEGAPPMDYSSHLNGTLYVPPRGNEDVPFKDLLEKAADLIEPEAGGALGQRLPQNQIGSGETLLKKLDALGITSSPHSDLDDIVTDFLANPPVVLPITDPARYFGPHGTACAGLVGGRPPEGDPTATVDATLDYFGVDPFCTLIPICTPYSHEILPVIHALLYAVHQNADVILMPRGLPFPDDRHRMPGQAETGSRITNGPARLEHLQEKDQANLAVLRRQITVFEDLLLAIAQRKYVVLAAGNEGIADALAYPASIVGTRRTSALPSNPTMQDPPEAAVPNGLLIASAVNRNGVRSSYSNGNAYADPDHHRPIPNVIEVLSDDGEVFNRDLRRADETSQFFEDFDLDPHHSEETDGFSPWGLLTLDVRGPYGYEVGYGVERPETSDHNDSGALYTLFGGTSAASSVLAGLIALGMEAGYLERAPSIDPAELLNKLQQKDLYPKGQRTQ